MKFIKFSFLFFLILFSSCEKNGLSDLTPGYRLINRFSKILHEKNGAILYCYGTSFHQSEENISRYGQQTFYVSYLCVRNKEDVVSLEDARCMTVSIVDSFLDAINLDPEVRNDLPVYPLTSDWVRVYIHFVDENHKELKTGGVSIVYANDGEIRYETFHVPPVTKQLGSITVYDEPYEDAHKIVMEQGCLQHY